MMTMVSERYGRRSARCEREARSWCKAANRRQASEVERAQWAKFGLGWFAVLSEGKYRIVKLTHAQARALGERFPG